MTRPDAILAAKQIADTDRLPMLVYRDPIGLGEQEGFDEPWGFCPAAAAYIIARFRELDLDLLLLPGVTYAPTLAVTAAHGVPFTARLVTEGTPYGLDFCLIHEEEEKPMIEFYDFRHKHAFDYVGDPKEAHSGTPILGQFVSRYYLGTLTGEDGFHGRDHRVEESGLDLHGGVADWQIDADSLAGVIEWAEGILSGDDEHVVSLISETSNS